MATIIIISGYFDPLHVGHIDYIQEARRQKVFGDILLYCIVNNDKQATLKKGKPFMKQEERVKIMNNIMGIDKVILSVDEDRTVCKTLRMISQLTVEQKIFINGGDVKEPCTEHKLCEDLNIRVQYGAGEKIQSSRNFYNAK